MMDAAAKPALAVTLERVWVVAVPAAIPPELRAGLSKRSGRVRLGS